MEGKRADTLKKIRLLAFDVQETLVDRRAGMGQALEEYAGISSPALRKAFLEHQIEAESEVLADMEEFLSFREILAASLIKAGSRCGQILPPQTARRVAASCGDWPFFADVGRAFTRLARRYGLALVDNAGMEDLKHLASRLPVPLRHIVSSETVQTYKPEPDAWLALLHELELEEDQVLAVSAAGEADVQIAEDLGIPAVYLNRRRKALPEEVQTLFRIRDLDGLVHRLMPARAPQRKETRK